MLQRYKKKIRYTNCVHKVVFLGVGMYGCCLLYLSYILRISFVIGKLVLWVRVVFVVG
jgi:hypothetical protein